MAASMASPTADGEVGALLAGIAALEKDLLPEKESVAKYKELQSEAEKHLGKATGKLSSRKKAKAALERQYDKLKRSGKLSADASARISASLTDAGKTIRDAESIAPSTGSLFVRFFLGQVNVRATSNKDRATLRDEYNKFKDRTNIGFLVLPTIWLITAFYLRKKFTYTDWIYSLTHVWLLYYYVSLSLRENILKVNGSNIRPWWIYHHYVSSLMSVVVLTWPADSPSWHQFLPQFTLYFLYQGIVQFAQARYQKARHYALTAMGKATHMDVSNTETLTEFHRGLYVIIFFVMVAQVWQIFNGYSLFMLLFRELDVTQPWYQFREEVQCILLGCMFIFLGVMNFHQTVLTLVDKSARERERTQLRRRESDATAASTALPESAAFAAEPAGVSAASEAAGTENGAQADARPPGVGAGGRLVRIESAKSGFESPLADATLVSTRSKQQ